MNKKEFKIVTEIYVATTRRAEKMIQKSVEEACEKYGFKNGSALTMCYRKHLEEATGGIKKPEFDDDYNLIYDKKDAFKMLKAIDDINTYILSDLFLFMGDD